MCEGCDGIDLRKNSIYYVKWVEWRRVDVFLETSVCVVFFVTFVCGRGLNIKEVAQYACVYVYILRMRRCGRHNSLYLYMLPFVRAIYLLVACKSKK